LDHQPQEEDKAEEAVPTLEPGQPTPADEQESERESERVIRFALDLKNERAIRFALDLERAQAVRDAQEEEREQEHGNSKVRFQLSLLQTLLLLFFPWTVKVYEQLQHHSLGHWGLQPGTAHGLWGLLTMPFLHKDFDHLSHNSFGLTILGMGLFYFYPRVAWPVIVTGSVVPALLVWCFGSPGYHIGASGVVYALSSFLFFMGVWRRDRASRGGALIVALLYGGSIWGVFPLQEGISWEGHFFGAMVGCYLAVLFRDVDLPPVVQISDDKENQDDEVLSPYWMESEPETDSERGPVP